MKKILTLMAVALLATATVWAADRHHKNYRSDRNRRGNTGYELPQNARNFIARNFSDTSIDYATTENGVFGATYEAVLENGTKIEFSKTGEWTEIDCGRGCSVPASVVPTHISEYVSKYYPGTRIRKIDRDRRGYEAELSNGKELTFNNEFRLVSYDK